jgi:hypothetical protein
MRAALVIILIRQGPARVKIAASINKHQRNAERAANLLQQQIRGSRAARLPPRCPPHASTS